MNSTKYLITAMCLLSWPALAQRYFGEPTEFAETIYSVPGSPTVSGLASAIREAAENKDWAKAVERLQELITDSPKTPIVPSEDETVRTGARVWAYQYLNALPEEALKVYRNTYEPEARRIFAEAATADTATATTLLSDIALRFRATPSGHRALEQLADLMLERGEFETALYYLRMLLPFLPQGESRAATALGKAATLCSWLGDYDEVETLRQWATRLGVLQLPDPRPDGSGTLADLLAGLLEARSRDHGAQDWPTMGGSPANASPAATVASPAELRWSAPMVTPWSEPASGLRRPAGQRRESIHRSLYPVVSEGVSYYSNSLEISATDIWTGNSRWSTTGFIPRSEATGVDENHAAAVVVGDSIIVANMEVSSGMHSKVYQDRYEIIRPIPKRILAAYDRDTGALLWTTDPRAARGEADVKELSGTVNAAGLRFSSPAVIIGDTVYAIAVRYEVNFNYYAVALDAATGQVRWRTFISSGLLEQNMFGNAVREAFPAAPAISEGLFFAVTNHGVVAALDIKSGDLVWMYLYTPAKMPINKSFDTLIRGSEWAPNPPVASRGVVVIAPTDSPRAYGLSAVDGREKWKFERTQILRSRDQDPVELSFDHLVGVGGIGGDKPSVLVAGKRSLYAIDLESGRVNARVSERLGNGSGSVIGRPALARDQIYVPLQRGIDVRQLDDKLTQVHFYSWADLLPSSAPNTLVYGLPGNLVVADGILLVGGRSYVGAFYQWETAHRSLALAAERDPRNPVLNLKLASVHYQRASATNGQDAPAADGRQDFEQAARFYQIANENSDRLPPTRAARVQQGARSGLFHVHRRWAEAEWRAGNVDGALEHLLGKAAGYAPTRQDEASAFLVAADLLVRAGRTDRAIDVYRQLAGRLGTFTYTFENGDAAQIAVYCLFRQAEVSAGAGKPAEAVQIYQQVIEQHGSDVYAGTDASQAALQRISALIDEYGREAVYADLDRHASEAFSAALAAGDLGAIQRLVARYPNATVMPAAELELGRTMLRSPETRVSGYESLRAAVRTGAPDVAASAAMTLARAHIEDGDLSRARDWLVDLRDRHPDVLIQDAGDQVSSRELARSMLEEPRFAELSSNVLRRIDNPLVHTPTSTTKFEAEVIAPLMLSASGLPPFAIGEPVYLASSNVLEARRTRDGNLAWDAPVVLEGGVKSERAAGYSGELLVLVEEMGVVAIEPLTGKVRWRWGKGRPSVLAYAISDELIAVVSSDTTTQRRDATVQVLSGRDGSAMWKPVPVQLRRGTPPNVQLIGTRLLVTEERGRGGSLWLDALTGRIINRIDQGAAGNPIVMPGNNRVIVPMRAAGERHVKPWVFDLDSGLLLADNLGGPLLGADNGVATDHFAAFVSVDFTKIVVIDPGTGKSKPRIVDEATIEIPPSQRLCTTYNNSALYTDGRRIFFVTTESDPQQVRARRLLLSAFDPATGARSWPSVVLSQTPFLDFDPSSVMITSDSLVCVLSPAGATNRIQGLRPPAPELLVVDIVSGAVRQILELPPPTTGAGQIVPPVARLVDGGIAVWHDSNLYFYGGAR